MKFFKTLETDEQESKSYNDDNFFTGNIGSLRNAASDVERIEIKQSAGQNFLFEETNFVLKEKPE